MSKQNKKRKHAQKICFNCHVLSTSAFAFNPNTRWALASEQILRQRLCEAKANCLMLTQWAAELQAALNTERCMTEQLAAELEAIYAQQDQALQNRLADIVAQPEEDTDGQDHGSGA